MAMKQDFIALLVCPESRMPMRSAPDAIIDRLNAGIRNGQVRNRAGQHLKVLLTEALIRQDGVLVYPVENGIPNLLIDSSIEIQKIS